MVRVPSHRPGERVPDLGRQVRVGESDPAVRARLLEHEPGPAPAARCPAIGSSSRAETTEQRWSSVTRALTRTAPVRRRRRAGVRPVRAARRRRPPAWTSGAPSRRAAGRSAAAAPARPAAVAARAGAGPDPRDEQRVLALEEPLRAHATGGAALARVLRERRDLHRGAGRAREGARAARGRDDDRLARGVDRAEPQHPRAVVEADAGHAARRSALRAHRGRGEVQQLRVGGDEDELLVTGGELDRADDPVAVVEPDDRPLVRGRGHVGRHPLHDAGGGAEREPRALAGDRAEADGLLALVELDERAERDAAGERRRAVSRWESGHLEHRVGAARDRCSSRGRRGRGRWCGPPR